MSVNRWKDLGAQRGTAEPDVESGSGETNSATKEDITAQMKQYEEVSEQIDAIKKNVEKINSLKTRDNKEADEAARKKILSDLDKVLNDCTSRARRVKDALDGLKEENDKFAAKPENANSARSQVRTNLYSAHVRRFQSVMMSFNSAREDFRSNLQDRMVRQLRMVDNTKTEEELVQIVESGKSEDIIRKALVSENLRGTIEDLEDRNAEILKLQRSVQELFELFKDLHALVELQGETLNVIEQRISNARDYTEKGTQSIREAAEYQTKARKRKCCLIMIVLIILVVILAPILGDRKSVV